MDRRPLVCVAGFWVAGSGVWSVRHGLPATLVYVGIVAALTAFVLAGRIRPRTGALCAAALLLSAGLRIWNESGHGSDLTAAWTGPEGRSVIASGRLLEPAAIDGDTVTFPLRASLVRSGDEAALRTVEKLLIRVRLSAEEELATAASWKRGISVEVAGTLKLPADAGNFGGFDYRHYLSRQDIYWTVSAKGAEAVRRTNGRVPLLDRTLRWFDESREAIGKLTDQLYGKKDAGYMKGLVAGIVDDIDPEQYDDFSRLGLTHVLAISGLHVAVVVYILLMLGKLVRWTRERSLGFAASAMPVYMLLTGASPSAVRACLMSMIALWLARQGKLKDGLHLLAASALIMVVWRPSVVEDVSFQLSFIVTAGLLLCVPVMNELLAIRIRSPFIRSSLAVALTAQLFSFPVTAYYFHQLHLLSLLANLVLVPFISFVVMPLGMAALALGAVWLPLGLVAAKLATLCNRATFAATDWLGSVKALATVWHQPDFIWVLAFYALLLATLAFARRSLRLREELAATAEAAAAQLAASDPFDPDERAERIAAYAGGAQTGGEWTEPLHGPLLRPRSVFPSAVAPEESVSAGWRSKRASATSPFGEGLAAIRFSLNARRIRRLSAALFALSWLGMLAWEAPPVELDRTGAVSFLDVGQGDSILITTGSGLHVLVDAGGTVTFGASKEPWRLRKDPYEVGRKTLVPLLKQRGIRRLDALVLTHLDADHIGGAHAIIRELQVGRIWFNGTIKPDADVLRLFHEAIDAGIPLYAIEAGATWRPDASATFEALYPLNSDGDDRIPSIGEQNDMSVVLRLTLYGRVFVLPGDLEASGETAVLGELRRRVGEGATAIDVLKAGHHGSKTSTTAPWLAWWNPTDVVVSAGKNNLYGHPHAEIVDRILASGAALERTDIQGEIAYRVRPDGRLERRTKRP
ncbi:ComEC/Rec2 family competence protein [Cohnella hashimotonis]|uniref:ComEC/Rec2 family competence protein n=1 Tax=Cohnella hashimotonis TaxID=2826895 RepID=A0ABT6TJ02_9BACL|nr:ComEC/Rec2 family competence protein [Cohnella hashimotonis]MDI4646700.1 ComEC/Rec2 family competence protein [Cohnella hashimotonis]